MKIDLMETTVLDAMPMMADVFSGQTHRPTVLGKRQNAAKWMRQTHALAKLTAFLSDAPADAEPDPEIASVFDLAGFPHSLTLESGRHVGLNEDGTRAIYWPKSERNRGGRPPKPTGEKMVQVSATISAADLETAKRLGDGNASAGIRAALDASAKKMPNSE